MSDLDPLFSLNCILASGQGVVLRIFTSISILYFSALKLPSSSVLICSSFFCIIALGSGQRLLYWLRLGLVLVLVLRFCVEVNILNVSPCEAFDKKDLT